ncbi:ABC-2 type transport system ATP-binding protein [Franzmannia pantelleriensis]|uniref:ABC-2 type transport system ATP-binding protein n=1 Tax=Franzmannia pantelleriensis TaxID=48727 RepID=A0A1G9M5B6_9GAMM|nr:ABC-2 type transport system ATP-binding protein [Halomonas pantelleriensis]
MDPSSLNDLHQASRLNDPDASRSVAEPVISISGLDKVYAGGFHALKAVDLSIRRGEIFALLGPNGAGKTTLISVVCGLVNPSGGEVRVDGFDNVRDYRQARALIGLVPQELTNEAFETVWNTVSFSRGLFGKSPDPAHIERVLKSLALWDKRNNRLITLSGGMKRRVLIAKALSHEPRILFLDEPTAGVDVELRRDMWDVVRQLRDSGVTIILTTHYIEEAEEMADRIGVINGGQIVLVEEKAALMRKLGSKQLTLHLHAPLAEVPVALADYDLQLAADGSELIYTYDGTRDGDEGSSITALLGDLDAAGIAFKDLHTRQSSLEDIFVDLVKERT